MSIGSGDSEREVISLKQAMDHLMEGAFVGSRRLVDLWGDSHKYPMLDIYDTKDDIVVSASLPGVKPEEVDITVTGDLLTIKGEFKQEEETKGRNYVRQERRYGVFSRELKLPVEVKSDKAEAVYENGVLTIKFPKAETAKPKQIKLKPRVVVAGSKK